MAISDIQMRSIKRATLFYFLLNTIRIALAVEGDAHQVMHGTATGITMHPSGAEKSATSFCEEQNPEIGVEGLEKCICKMPGLLCDLSHSTCQYPAAFGNDKSGLTVSLYTVQYTLLPINSSIFTNHCTLATEVLSPSIFLTLDHENAFHFIKVQALPLFLALCKFGLQDGSFSLFLIDATLKGRSGRFFKEFERLSGAPVRFVHELPSPYCMGTTIIGVDANVIFPMHWTLPEPSKTVSALQRDVAAFRAWMLHKYLIDDNELLSSQNLKDHSTPRLLIPLRLGENVARKLMNPHDLAAAAISRDWCAALSFLPE